MAPHKYIDTFLDLFAIPLLRRTVLQIVFGMVKGGNLRNLDLNFLIENLPWDGFFGLKIRFGFRVLLQNPKSGFQNLNPEFSIKGTLFVWNLSPTLLWERKFLKLHCTLVILRHVRLQGRLWFQSTMLIIGALFCTKYSLSSFSKGWLCHILFFP